MAILYLSVATCAPCACVQLFEASLDRLGIDTVTFLSTMQLASILRWLKCLCVSLCSPFGSRVAERLLERLGQLLDSAHDQEIAERLYEVPLCKCAQS